MADNHSNRFIQYDNLFILLLFGLGIIGLTFLLAREYDLTIWEKVLDQGWFLVAFAVAAGFALGFLRWKLVQRNFINGFLGLLSLVVAYLLGAAMVKYFQVPNIFGWWLATIEIGVHFLMKVVVDNLPPSKLIRRDV